MSICPHGKETGRCIEICDAPRPQKATPGRVIQVHMGDEWLVGMVLVRTEHALGDLPGFLARVFSVYNGPVPTLAYIGNGADGFLKHSDFNAPFADEHVGKTWRWPPRDGAS